MLSIDEKIFATELLGALGFEELVTIAKTTTNRILNPTTKEEAIDVIISYEEDARSLLNRKKVTKVLLFNYLHWKKASFPANADKTQLVDVVLDLWKTNKVHHQSTEFKQITGIPEENKISKICIAGSGNDVTLTQIGEVANNDWVSVMSVKFSEWFYTMMNKDASDPSLKEDDFWTDATARVKILSGSDGVSYEAKRSQEVVGMIRGIIKEHRLMFNPNLNPNGVRGKEDSHGMVKVLVCGTLHQGVGQCVGVFEQIFLLIKDPLSSDNWKIKNTDLNLRTKSGITGLPCLEEGEFIGQLVKVSNPN